MDIKHIEYLNSELLQSKKPIWINPVGGLGDIIMLSTALKCSYDKYEKSFVLLVELNIQNSLEITLLFKK